VQPTGPQPIFLNIEYFFLLITRFFGNIFSIEFLERLRVIATVLVILLIAGILYLLVRLHELKAEANRKKQLLAPVAPMTPAMAVAGEAKDGSAIPAPAKAVRNETWEAIRAKLLSENQSDWRLAIIEADIYMDRLLDDRGFHGDTTSDKLKQIGPGQLASVQIAWEAHKVRNRIAHDGAAFMLTQPEARRVLSYFEIVFRDLEAIQ
jgi:hypothetical protein